MLIPTLRFTLLVLLACGSAAALLPAAEADAERLIEELRSDDFDLRRNAATQLEALGEKARSALKKASESDHPEVRATASGLLKKLETSSLVVTAYDRDGKPLGGVDADVKLYARQRAFANEWSEPKSENIQTQPNGRVEIPNLSPGLLNIQFEWKKMSVARDSTSWWNLDLQRGPNPVVMTLTRGAEVSFLIKNEAGEPLRDATVTLYANRALESDLLELQLSLIEQWDRSGLTATSDKEGVAKFESINEGSFQAVVRADGHLPALGPVITSRSGQVLSIPAITLQPKKSGKLSMVLTRHVAEAAKDGKDPKEKAKQAEANAAKVMEVAKAMEAAKAGDAAKAAEAAKAAAEDAKKKVEAAAKAEDAKANPAKDEKAPGNDAKANEVADANAVKKQRVFYELEFVFDGPRAEELQKKQRQLRQALNMYRQAESPETDEQGRITIEDLKPGRYRLTVGSGMDTPWRVDDFEVKAGETTDLGTLRNADGGTVKGKLVDTEGKGLQYMNVTAVPETDEEDDQAFRQNFSSRQLYGTRNVQTQKDGAYEFKNLLPGRYTLTTYTRKAQPVRIEGIVVEAGKTVEAPEARIPSEGGGKSFVVKGVVKQPDGKPAANASINLHSATFGRWTRNTDDKGQFDFNFSPEQGWTPTAVSAKAANCKSIKVDLTAPGVNFENVVIQLEKQEYGTLRIKVTDEKGKPLEGALVRPRQTRVRYNAFNQIIDRRAITNRNGEARISGLAAGQRTFTVELDGYYAADAVNVVVLQDAEAEASVLMKRGMMLRGRVEIPPGMQAASMAAVLSGATTQTCALDAEGRFEFDGLAPAEYSIGAVGPALTVIERVKVQLKAGEVPPDVMVKVARPGGVAIGLPAAFSYGSVALVRREKEKDGAASTGMLSYISGGIDRDGRVEAWGAAPGEYEVLIHPSAPMSVLAPYRQNQGRQVKEARASLFAGGVTVQALKSFEDLRAAEAIKLNVPESSASVKGTIAITPPLKGAQQSTGNLTVRLVSEQAQATVSYNFPNELSQNPQQRTPLVFGGSKKGKTANVTPPGSFKFSGLPAGEYKMYVEIVPYRYSQTPLPDVKEKKVAVPLQMVTVKAGEALDLGPVEFKPTPEMMEASRQVEDMNSDTEPEDQVPVFQP